MPVEKTTKVIVVRVGEPPVVQEMPDSLKAYQELAGGIITTTSFDLIGCRYTIVCNDEGMINGMPRNRYIPQLGQWIHGDFFITKADGRGNFVSLSRRDLANLLVFISMVAAADKEGVYHG